VLGLVGLLTVAGCGAPGDPTPGTLNNLGSDNNGADLCGDSVCGGGGTMCCDETCVNPNTARNHCGGCGVACGPLEDCFGGACRSRNNPPTASAGADRTARVGRAVMLDGSGSSDPDGDPLTYAWTLTVPDGSDSTLEGADTPTPRFVPDRNGRYLVTLVVNDGHANSPPAGVRVDASTDTNNPPEAQAGPDRDVTTGQPVTLDGSASSDADQDPLTFAWTLLAQPDGSDLTLDAADTATASFTPPLDGDYVFELIVNDGRANSPPDTVTITAGPEANTAPVALAGDDVAVVVGTEVVLDGSASTDPDGDPLTFAWRVATRPDASVAALVGADQESASFTPDIEGDYVVELIVNDGTDDSPADRVNLTASPSGNTPPVADAGPDQSVTVGARVVLDGTASGDDDGDALTFAWTFASAPPTSQAALTGGMTSAPEFTADVVGTWEVELIVNDGTVASAASTVTITAADVPNATPVAHAGTDVTVAVGTPVTLDGSGSTDADGDPLTYAWTIQSAPATSTAALSAANTAAPGLTPDLAGDYLIRLVVNDGTVDSAPDTVLVTATVAANQPPTACIGGDMTGTVAMAVSLDAACSTDPDGDGLTYLWTLTSAPMGSTLTLLDTTMATLTFTPDVEGAYELTLEVSDVPAGATDTLSTTVTVTP